MTTFDATAYGPAVAEILSPPRLAVLGPGIPNAERRNQLLAFDIETAFGVRLRDRSAATACLSGLWLYHDFLDESHSISQDLATPEGSFWHAILHRREPDPSNSKYWWRRVGQHPVLDQLRERAPEVGCDFTTPFAFVDFVERVRGAGSAEEEIAKQVQLIEWQLLFDWCFTSAK